jgi:hypothetical protein
MRTSKTIAQTLKIRIPRLSCFGSDGQSDERRMVCLAKRGMGVWGPRTVGNKKGPRRHREREKGGEGRRDGRGRGSSLEGGTDLI